MDAGLITPGILPPRFHRRQRLRRADFPMYNHHKGVVRPVAHRLADITETELRALVAEIIAEV